MVTGDSIRISLNRSFGKVLGMNTTSEVANTAPRQRSLMRGGEAPEAHSQPSGQTSQTASPNRQLTWRPPAVEIQSPPSYSIRDWGINE
jgi:hypothetical protein